MSRLDNFIRSLASPVTKGGVDRSPDETAGDSRRRSEWRHRRRRYNSGDGVVEKQSVDRRAQAFAAIQQSVVEAGGMRKPYDPLFLRDLSANAVVQAYIDTLSQDVASASWTLRARDEDATISDAKLAEYERDLRSIHPELPFHDVLEGTSRILLELGDATWVKHYYEGTNDLAEAVVVDSSTMFKQVDDFGITDSYIQASRRNRDVANKFDTDEVVWFSWSIRPDRHYGQGPLEKSQNEVELVEELAEKERLDLIAGSNPGVISPDYNDEFGGTVPDEDWDTFVEQMQLDEGERHRVGYSKIPVAFEPITANYQELQILQRSKYWVTVLGSVFKVNPSYAGFDFENVNRATDKSQREAFKQRGFRVTLQQLEESLNRQLVWTDISDDVVFEFEREQTPEERETRASLIREQAEAGQEMATALEDSEATVSFRDGRLVVEDGEITPSEDDGGDMGGIFASVDKASHWELAVEDGVEGFKNTNTGTFVPVDEADVDQMADLQTADGAGDTGNGNSGDGVVAALSDDEWAAYERSLIDAHKSQIQPDSVDDIEKRAWNRDDEVPEYVREGVLESIDRGAIFDQIQSVPGTLRETLEDTLRDSLTQPQGWSLDSITDRLSDAFPGVDDEALETVARTETTSVLNEAREVGYESREDADRFRFYWQGSEDSRTTQLCEDLMIATGSASGTPEAFDNYPGESVDMKTLVRLEREASNYHFPDLQFRRHVPHINCRKTFVRDAAADVDIDVDVPGANEFNKASCKSDHDADAESYADVVGGIGEYIKSRSSREREIEQALGEDIRQVLRRAFDESDGAVEGAKRAIDRRLKASPNYDHKANGLLSKPTLYRYRNKYEDRLDGVL